MRADSVVVVTPPAGRLPHMSEVVEDLFIEELIPQTSIEVFDEGVLRRLAWRDVMPAGAVAVLPFKHCAAGQLCSIVADNHPWLAMETDERVELAGGAQTRDRRAGDQAEAFAREVMITARMRNLRPNPNTPERKPRLQRCEGPAGIGG